MRCQDETSVFPWQSCDVSLHNNTLHIISTSIEDEKVSIIAPLYNATISDTETPGKDEFEVALNGKHGVQHMNITSTYTDSSHGSAFMNTTLYFKASNEQDRSQWVLHIKKAITLKIKDMYRFVLLYLFHMISLASVSYRVHCSRHGHWNMYMHECVCV